MFRAFPKPRAGRALASASTLAVAAAGVTLSSDLQTTQKLSIYPQPESETILLDTPSPLEHQIGQARRKITETIRQVRDEGQGIVNKWIGVEQAVEKRVKSIVSPKEQITAGLLYTGIATLTGSIMARNRSYLARLTLPGALFFVSLNHFLPETTGNLSSYVGSVEERYFPKVAEKHAIANAHARMTWERVKESTRDGREWVGRNVDWSVKKVQEVTGLKVRDVVGGRKEGEGTDEVKKADS